MTHWASTFIGAPYKKFAVGPKEFDCLGFIEHIFKTVKGIYFPLSTVRVDESNNEERIREITKAIGLRLVNSTPQEDDVIVVENSDGPHIGMVIRISSGLRLLHCVEGIGVCHFPMSELGMYGYKNMRVWRIAPC